MKVVSGLRNFSQFSNEALGKKLYFWFSYLALRVDFKVLQLFNQHEEIFLTSHWLTDRINGIDAFLSASPFFLQGTRNGAKNFMNSSCVKFYKKFTRIFLNCFQLSHGYPDGFLILIKGWIKDLRTYKCNFILWFFSHCVAMTLQ